jgi:hypothetical protein
MSEKEHFLSRWARRKHEAAGETKLLPEDKTKQAVQPETPGLEKPQAALTQDKPSDEPLFDLSKLPSLDSIGPGTDLRVFMQPGVPASLSRAALRRAWSADPAIRDFVGLSENSWDFTKPESISGFGPLLPIDDVKRMLSRVLGADDEPQAKELTQPAALRHEDSETKQTLDVQQVATGEEELDTENSVDERADNSTPRCTQNDLALQQESSAERHVSAPIKRRHGGALPT